MQWADVLARLNDLPATFLRTGPNFTAFQAALTNGLHKMANSIDGAVDQGQATQAIGKWLDVVGRARNMPRYNGEPDSTYFARIVYLLNTPGGPPNAILGLLAIIGDSSSPTISENFATCSWSVGVNVGVSGPKLTQLTNSLGYVRPAGVPYQINVSRGGLYLNTLNYLGRPRVTGAYLVNATNSLPLNLSSNTNNAINLLPTIYLSDPTLNPGL